MAGRESFFLPTSLSPSGFFGAFCLDTRTLTFCQLKPGFILYLQMGERVERRKRSPSQAPPFLRSLKLGTQVKRFPDVFFFFHFLNRLGV